MPCTRPPRRLPPRQAAGGREGLARRAPGCRPVLRLCPSTNPALSSTRCPALYSCTAVQLFNRTPIKSSQQPPNPPTSGQTKPSKQDRSASTTGGG